MTIFFFKISHDEYSYNTPYLQHCTWKKMFLKKKNLREFSSAAPSRRGGLHPFRKLLYTMPPFNCEELNDKHVKKLERQCSRSHQSYCLYFTTHNDYLLNIKSQQGNIPKLSHQIGVSNSGSPNEDNSNCCLFPSRNMGASHSNCSLVIDMPGLVLAAPPRQSGDGPASPASHIAFVPEQYVTSPSRIIPSPATSESFNGVDLGTKGRENTRREKRAGEAIEQPHDDERTLAHSAYLGRDGAAEEAVSSHG